MTQESIPDILADSHDHGEPAQGLTLEARVEALLFVADGPVSTERLVASLMTQIEEIEEAIESLRRSGLTRGVRLQRKGQYAQLVTAPELAGDIERFLGLDLSGKLSPAALETLAIIAYKQPITRAEIDSIRGVQSDSVIRSLVSKGLIEEVGRLEQAGRPIVYGTTFEFLQYFGLQDLSQLPPLEPGEEEFSLPASNGELQSEGQGMGGQSRPVQFQGSEEA